MEVQQRLAHQRGIAAHGIGVLCFQAGIHAVLKLLVIGAVHIGLQHAVFQRPHADLPELGHPWGGGLHTGFYRQRVAGLVELRRKDRDRAEVGFHRQADKAEGPHPEGLKAELTAVEEDRIGDPLDFAAHIGAHRVRAGAAEFFKIRDLYSGPFAACKAEAWIGVQDRSGVQQDLLFSPCGKFHAALGKQRERFPSSVKAADKALLFLIEQRDLPLAHAEHGRHAHKAEGILRHTRLQSLRRAPDAAIEIGIFPMDRRLTGVELFDHCAEKLGVFIGSQSIAVIQPYPPVGKAGCDRIQNIPGVV